MCPSQSWCCPYGEQAENQSQKVLVSPEIQALARRKPGLDVNACIRDTTERYVPYTGSGTNPGAHGCDGTNEG